jgi:hypothetical protein
MQRSEMMTATRFLRLLLIAGALTLTASAANDAAAQGTISNPNPSAGSVALAKELIALKGGQQMFDNVVAGVVESVKNQFLPTNPQLSKPLSDVAAQLRTELEPKKGEIFTQVATAYARHFTENELKELLTFYRTPLGKKVLTEESNAVEDGFKRATEWQGAFSEQVLSKFRAEMKKKGYDL